VVGAADGQLPPGYDLLFRVRADGRLVPVTESRTPEPEAGDKTVMLGPAAITAR
jgi:hypothetical protein